jgi:hypothetical protein
MHNSSFENPKTYLLRVRTSQGGENFSPPMFFRSMLFRFELENALGETPTVSRCHNLRNLGEWKSNILGCGTMVSKKMVTFADEN